MQNPDIPIVRQADGGWGLGTEETGLSRAKFYIVGFRGGQSAGAKLRLGRQLAQQKKMSKLLYVPGDLFSAPSNIILVHACNTAGAWGAGIALAFREKYPAQYRVYKAHCEKYARLEQSSLIVGTCLLIPGDRHDIACLFTSRGYGRRKDSPDEILSATRTAVQDLMGQNLNAQGKALHAWYVEQETFIKLFFLGFIHF